MLWRVVVPCLLAARTQAFTPTPLRWGGAPAGGFVLAPRALPNRVIVPSLAAESQKLTIWDAKSHGLSRDEIPNFAPQIDQTIAWESTGLCIEAAGVQKRDVVSVGRCTGAPTQKWEFLPWSGGTQIQLKDTQKCIEVDENEGGLNGATVMLGNCEGKLSESWDFEDIPLPTEKTGTPSLKHVGMFLVSMVALGTVSVSAWLWRTRKSARVALAMSPEVAPSHMEQGVSMAESSVSHAVPQAHVGQRSSPITMNVIAEKAEDALPGFVKDLLNIKPSLADALPDCPATIWNADSIDVDEWQAKYRAEGSPACPVEVVATPEANAAGVEYFKENRTKFQEMLQKHGSIWFRGFDLTKDPKGFRSFWEEGLELPPCLDPIHSSGLRKFEKKNDAVYEAVNKEGLAQHYIGLHNEATFCKTATSGAFVCFKPATVSGGEFFIADGEQIFRDMDADVLKRFLERKVRISVSNLDFDFLKPLPGGMKQNAKEAVGGFVGEKVAPKFDMDLDMVWGTDGREMRLQAIETAQSPVNRHPVTGRPVWFCNMHNHSRYLRDRRPCTVPEVGMTDVYYGDLDLIPGEDFEKMKEACEKNIVRVPMQTGDVVLCDNYRVLHGRDIFEGDRLHAVSWFGDGKGKVASGTSASTGDTLNNFINKFVVGN